MVSTSIILMIAEVNKLFIQSNKRKKCFFLLRLQREQIHRERERERCRREKNQQTEVLVDSIRCASFCSKNIMWLCWQLNQKNGKVSTSAMISFAVCKVICQCHIWCEIWIEIAIVCAFISHVCYIDFYHFTSSSFLQYPIALFTKWIQFEMDRVNV